METYDILDETSAEEHILTPYAGKKARHTGLWMLITAVAGVVLFGGLTALFIGDKGLDTYETEETVLLVFFLAMTFKYTLLLTSAVQTRIGAKAGRQHLLQRAAFNARIVWVFVGILALIGLLQMMLYWTTGFEMFGEFTREIFRVI